MKHLCSGLLGSAVLGALVLYSSTGEAAEAKEKIVYSFCSQQSCSDGDGPVAGVLDLNGVLYGTTEGGGTGGGAVFSLDPKTGAETVIHAFSGSDGSLPEAGLNDELGKLYGTTEGGGSAGWGTVFSIDLGTGAETVLHSFAGGADGAGPMAGVAYVRGMLYGTTYAGGTGQECTGGCGTVFSVDPSTGAEKVLYSFCSQQTCADGAQPLGDLIYADEKGTLFGTTSRGGTGQQACGGAACGTVFAIDRKTGAETVLHDFCTRKKCTDGGSPTAGLLLANYTLYGTTSLGGAHNGGIVFAMVPESGALTVVYSFCSRHLCADGASPSGLIALGPNGLLYGTTEYGGGGAGADAGTAFSLDPATGVETVLHSFCNREDCTDGQKPLGGLLVGNSMHGTYGTTASGGANGQGVVFMLK